MTTNNSIEVAHDIFQNNDTFTIPGNVNRIKPILSAATLVYCSRDLLRNHAQAIETLYQKIKSKMPSYSPWLFLSNGALVYSNRVIEYYRLWGGIKRMEAVLPAGEKSQEYIVRRGNKVQFFGAVRLNDPDFSVIANFISIYASAYFLMSSADIDIAALSKDGWSSDPNQNFNLLLDSIATTSDFIFLPLGAFDDCEGGAAVIASPDLIDSCFGL